MPTPTLQHALSLLQQDAVDDAIAVLNDLVERIPAHAAAHVLRARALEAKHDWETALRAWEQVHFLVPTSPTVADGKQRVLRRLDPTTDNQRPNVASASTEMPNASTPTESNSEPAPSADPAVSSASEALSELDPVRHEADAETAPPPDAPSSDESASAPDDSVPPGLKQLRQQADAEARGGGARGSLPDDATATGDPDADSLSDLEQLRRQADAEAQRGGTRGGPRPSSDAADDPSASPSDLDADFDDLDRLIEELESARITPAPDPQDAPAPDVPEPDAMEPPAAEETDDADDLVSETLARIYASQGKYREAMRAYIKLAAQKPDQMRPLLEKAAAMREEAEMAQP